MKYDGEPAYPALPDTEIHIWQASLAVSSRALRQFALTLSLDEQKRADRFRFPRDSHRFIASRGILRSLLGRYVQTPPEQLQFCYGANGKPALANELANGLAFNISHSEDLMLCAIARCGGVGIDLEHLRPISHLDALTERFFSSEEHAAIHALPDEARLRSFFQHWTCKEALIKATGEGLMSLSAITLQINDDVAKLVSWNHAEHAAGSWFLELFTPTPAYIAAIAADARGRSLVFLQWDAG
ncbi:4'-phosphopantetheinyl transferase family protein [Stenomitos frigidus]|uniref:4'-phosphopantetheinyl transferase n=1 Tax=Stenomitos frigidus ULC18 TaxID=2107698 RepID=A0A2T1EGL3_9CYAN|nr:4'-phosphopantetheinyl transferase superfamily protein [Stenomitos frigidus]PSB31838.1 4'-phosphopantetheinyl transferase [Stenomitos frigidus ULC18]